MSYAQRVAAAYREWAAAGARGIDPISALDAEHECRHGRLPSDRTPPCGCWPYYETPVPAISRREAEDLMSTDEQVEAPFGFKADGTPRKRPAPSADQQAKAAAARAANRAPAISTNEAEDLVGRIADEVTRQREIAEARFVSAQQELRRFEAEYDRLRKIERELAKVAKR